MVIAAQEEDTKDPLLSLGDTGKCFDLGSKHFFGVLIFSVLENLNCRVFGFVDCPDRFFQLRRIRLNKGGIRKKLWVDA